MQYYRNNAKLDNARVDNNKLFTRSDKVMNKIEKLKKFLKENHQGGQA